MQSFYVDNGIKVICENREVNLVSFSIAIDAGAAVEEIYGLAHVVEHMVFKGTYKRSEKELNALFDKYFGFYNAMTNFPYVVYYGTTLLEDIEKGFELYTDVLTKPSFKEEGFIEEMKVIKEELNDWKKDSTQNCEDILLSNAFENRRIKERIIGNNESLDKITMDHVRDFYKKHYNPKNMVISFVGGISLNSVKKLCNKYLGNFKKDNIYIHKDFYENNKVGTFKEEINSGNLQYIFPVHHLSSKEIKAIRILLEYIGGSTSSILYEDLRTEKGLIYDLSMTLCNERDIKLLMLKTSSSDKNIDEVKCRIDEIFRELMYNLNISEDKIKLISKRIKTKVELFLEKSIQLAKEISVYEIMYGDYKVFLEQFNNLEDITLKDLQVVAKKVLGNSSVQIVAKNK